MKWFNPDKGFGFVELSDGTGDAFLHASALTRAGGTTVAAGTPLKVRVGQGQKGRQVTEITEIGEAPSTPPASRREGGFRPGGGAAFSAVQPSGGGQEMGGTVKWDNAQKGFGFITPEVGGKDVFVHATALARSGITELHEGQAVRLQVVQGKKGPEAASISLP